MEHLRVMEAREACQFAQSDPMLCGSADSTVISGAQGKPPKVSQKSALLTLFCSKNTL